MLRIFTFQKTLKNGAYAENTKAQYLSCIQRLREEGITESSTSEEVRDALYRISQKPRTRKIYIAAITEYEKTVMGVQEGLLKGSIRQECIKDAQDDTTGIEPKKPEQTYRVLINRLKDKKLKAALLLQLESGLRIGEVAVLEKKNITMHHNRIWLDVKPGKTKMPRIVQVRYNKELYALLSEYIDSAENFPFAGTTHAAQDFLAEHGGATHDLRRHNARHRYKELRESGLKKYAALNIVAKQLGHNNLVNTKRYLGTVWTADKGGIWK